jgi:hypothetical protein
VSRARTEVNTLSNYFVVASSISKHHCKRFHISYPLHVSRDLSLESAVWEHNCKQKRDSLIINLTFEYYGHICRCAHIKILDKDWWDYPRWGCDDTKYDKGHQEAQKQSGIVRRYSWWCRILAMEGKCKDPYWWKDMIDVMFDVNDAIFCGSGSFLWWKDMTENQSSIVPDNSSGQNPDISHRWLSWVRGCWKRYQACCWWHGHYWFW